LFSQCQAIHARSIMPCMDTPSVKSSYDAEITVPTGMVCLMSAIGKDTKKSGEADIYTFHQPVTIPSYLLAIVVGHIERRDISARCAVWCEPSIVDSAKWEFESTEKILQTAEKLAGPYRWGRYDLVVLPPTFPFGGMENPCLTFVTPTLLAGDRSLVNVVAHEIAHSWTGNLVSTASWEHFWLNEGFTVFLERKIIGRLEGELERQFESECGYDECLTSAVKTFGEAHEFTKLIPKLNGIDPDDAFSSVPYEKGSALLLTIEQLIGDSDRFEQFLRTYIDK
uniref:Peptidase_M1 domain-containing protein n=1 Tax=Heligmosomoides polygyrus TaxID=6339 RepID=A0A183GNY4_HELPZ